MTTTDRPQALYRFFDQAGELLYVGISANPAGRWDQHRHDKPWWSEVATVGIQEFPSRPAVEDAERVAIRSERPRYNLTHHPDRSPRRTWRKGRDCRDLNISARLPSELVARLGLLAKAERRSRSAMLMLLLEEALDARESKA